MASHSSNGFRDGQLEAYLPVATAVYDIEQSPEVPNGTSHVDWAWDEPKVHFLCELKDPESRWALEDEDGVERLQEKLEESIFLKKLARKAYNTSIHHSPSKQGPNSYVVVVAITTLTGPEMDAAGIALTREMKDLGISSPGLIVNIDRWNELLAPRTLTRL